MSFKDPTTQSLCMHFLCQISKGFHTCIPLLYIMHIPSFHQYKICLIVVTFKISVQGGCSKSTWTPSRCTFSWIKSFINYSGLVPSTPVPCTLNRHKRPPNFALLFYLIGSVPPVLCFYLPLLYFVLLLLLHHCTFRSGTRGLHETGVRGSADALHPFLILWI